MTAPLPLAPVGDTSLIGLDFLQAIAENNRVNWCQVLDGHDVADLFAGVTRVALKLAQALAARSGSPVDEVFEVHRALFLHYGNPRSET